MKQACIALHKDWAVLTIEVKQVNVVLHRDWAVLLFFLLLKTVGNSGLEASDVHTISLKAPTPQYQPIER